MHLPTESERPAPRRRRRPAKSCTPCRTRKIKCDLGEPCSQCLKARAPLQCSYEPYVKRNHGHRLESVNVDSGVAAALQEVQSRLSSLEGASYAVPPRTPPPTASALNEQLQRTVDELKHRLAQIESRTPAPSQPSPSCTVASTSSVAAATATVPQVTPKLRVSHEKTKLFGPNHFMLTINEFIVNGLENREVEVNMSISAPNVDFPCIRDEFNKMRKIIKTAEIPALVEPVPDVLSTLPSRDVCDKLVAGYLRTCEPMYRILHIPTFQQEYESFWLGNPPTKDSIFDMTLLMVLAIGITFLDSEQEKFRHLVAAKSWVIAAEWRLTSLHRKVSSDIKDVQLACLIQLARQMTPIGNSWTFIGTLTQMAYAAGLHRDPEQFPSPSPFETVMRRRLWATVMELQLQYTIDQASAPPMGPLIYDTKTPPNYNDADLSIDMESLPSEIADGIHTDSSVQRALLASFPLRLRITNILQDFTAPQDHATAIELSQEVRAAFSNISSFFDKLSPSDKAVLQVSQFQRDFIGALLQRQIIILHRPFVLQARNDMRFSISRKLCMDAALAVVQYGKDMDLERDKMNDICRMFVTVTGPLKGPLSLYFISTIVLEIFTQLEDQDTMTNEILCLTQQPVLDILQHICDQSLPLMKIGRPSLKRYGLLSTMLIQIRAMQKGTDPREALLEWVQANLQTIRGYLQTKLDTIRSEQSAIENLTALTFPDFDFNMLEDAFMMDMSMFFKPYQ